MIVIFTVIIIGAFFRIVKSVCNDPLPVVSCSTVVPYIQFLSYAPRHQYMACNVVNIDCFMCYDFPLYI